MDRTSIAGVDAVVISVCSQSSLCGKDVLELCDEFHQPLGFSGKIWPRTGYNPLQFTQPKSTLRFGFQIVYWRRPRDRFTVTEGGASSKNLVLVTHIHNTDWYLLPCSNHCPGYVQSFVGSRQFSMRPFATSRGSSSNAITTLSHLASITSLLTRVSFDDRGRALSPRHFFSAQLQHMTPQVHRRVVGPQDT